MGEGNKWRLSLIAPACEHLLAIQSGERVLDLACGNGQFAKRLAYLGAHVAACDFSSALLDCARLRTVDGLDEPTFAGVAEDFTVRWQNCVEILPIVAVRFRPV